MDTQILPDGWYVIWFSKTNPTWYIRLPDGSIVGANEVQFEDGETRYRDDAFPGLLNGPKGVIVARKCTYK